jgi:polysaccharide pyruvyl transferase CsaB
MPGDGKIFDVLLAGYFGFGNLGDELLLEAAVKNLEKCGVPRDKIAALSNNPDETRLRVGIEAFSRWSVKSVFHALGVSRFMIMPGGGLFQDASSVKSCVYYWGLARAAGMKSVPVAALGQSVGPLSSKAARFLARDAFSRCAYVAVRDSASARMLQRMRIPHDEMPDPVMSLDVEANVHGDAVLINARPVPGPDAYSRPIARAAKILAREGVKLIYVAMSGEDAGFMSDLQKKSELPKGEIISPKDVAGFSEAARLARAAVGMRLHFGILSMKSGLDVVLSPYDPKVSSFAEEWGIKQLKEENDNENFDIMRLLTNSRFRDIRDKRKFEKIHLQVTGQFQKALGLVLGEDNGRGKIRRV